MPDDLVRVAESAEQGLQVAGCDARGMGEGWILQSVLMGDNISRTRDCSRSVTSWMALRCAGHLRSSIMVP